MIEIIAVLVIVGLLAGVATTSFMSRIEKAKVITTKTSLGQLSTAVGQFYLDVGRHPDEDEGLEAIVMEPADAEGWAPGGYLESDEVPTDGWGNDFVYLSPAENDRPFVIISYGADGEEGGEGNDTDLKSTDAN